MAGAAVILLQADGARTFVLLLKIEDVFDRRAPEFVDALVIVSDDADVAPAVRQQRSELVLQVVRVLILVDEHIPELPLPIFAHVVKIAQQAYGVVNQVVKIHRAGGKQAAPVFLIRFANLDFADVPRRPRAGEIRLRRDLRVLGTADLRQQRAVREALVVQLHVLDDVLHHRLAVRRVIDREAVRIAQPIGVPPQDTHTGRVERGRPDVRRLRAEHLFQPLLQFPRRLVRKRDGDDAPGIDAAIRGARLRRPVFRIVRLSGAPLQQGNVVLRRIVRKLVRVRCAAILQQIGNAVDQHRGFAAASPRQQQQRAFRRQHRLSLHRIEAGKFRLNEALARSNITCFKIITHSD